MELTATVTAIMAIMSFGFLAAVILGVIWGAPLSGAASLFSHRRSSPLSAAMPLPRQGVSDRS